ncbi:hypothetical protein [Streptosporangium roseum]|uniref:Uncharacterized protein n=1 Tax=Streptosporangium roseum (strain ATCC 12428 / DSM 43021 / JCM 3005 / KCTC 9067 / NCIMB 10171 / NRRL 2505 / NI 9100) TaxID=479432 RepID=D2B5L5_STRRD|nr:hypothetical protein [Streptosporangium roseum]ACZ89520.1 hypothetical protein Sros_6812 [Streptosporangium roseum DSM 43021]
MSTDVGTAAAPRATRREWLGLAILALPAMLIAVDLTVLHLALPAPVAEAAEDTLAAAVNVARELPAAQGSGLVSVAREAFVYGLQTTAIVGAVLAVLLATVAATLAAQGPDAGPASACGGGRRGEVLREGG